VFGPADFPGKPLFAIGFQMGIAWPVGGLVLWVAFSAHKADADWKGGKWSLYVAAVMLWTMGLSTYFHLGAASSDADAKMRDQLATPARAGDVKTVSQLIALGAD